MSPTFRTHVDALWNHDDGAKATLTRGAMVAAVEAEAAKPVALAPSTAPAMQEAARSSDEVHHILAQQKKRERKKRREVRWWQGN